MTKTREALLAEARFQQSYAVSDSIHEGPAVGFVGLALLTQNGKVFGGHATGENYLEAVKSALGSLRARYQLAVGVGEPIDPKAFNIADVVLVTSRNLDDIPPSELDVLKHRLGLPTEHQIGLRRELTTPQPVPVPQP